MTEETQTGVLGRTAEDEAVRVTLERLIGSHACVIANSGGGKSGLVRRLLETTAGRVQQIILDGEDEFYTLRERFDYVIAGGDGGDIPAKLNNARDLAIGALTHGFSLICQLNDLGHSGAPTFIGEFLDAMIHAPRALWHPVLVVVDEAQRFAPRLGSTEATSAIQALLAQGRKRGFTAVLAGTKLTDVDPSVRGMVNNWMFGRVGQSLDRNTMADALGFTPKEGRDKLRRIVDRHFWGFGPAISDEPVFFRVDDVETTPIHAGDAKVTTPPAPEALREILAGLVKPEPAAEETPASKDQAVIDPNPELEREVAELRERVEMQGQLLAEECANVLTIKEQRDDMRAAGLSMALRVRAAADDLEEKLEQISPLDLPRLPTVEEKIDSAIADIAEAAGQRVLAQAVPRLPPVISARSATDDGTMNPTAAAFADMLDQINPARVTWAQLCSMTHRKPQGGNFNTARRQLRESGRMIEEMGRLRSSQPTGRGLTRTQALDLWRGVLVAMGKKRAPEIFDVLRNASQPMTKEEIGEAIGISTVGGNWNDNWGAVKNNGLLENAGPGFFLAAKLPGER